MITITFDKDKGQLTVNGQLMAEGQAEELEIDNDKTLIGMAFAPAKHSRTLKELSDDGVLKVDELAMTLSLLHVMFPGGVHAGMNLALSLQDVEPWLDNLDEQLPLPELGEFALTLPSEREDEDESTE
tara:strand:- start:1636 stop:2019 length:384 start_codon:yes stop_codon:yes gene_type:complete